MWKTQRLVHQYVEEVVEALAPGGMYVSGESHYANLRSEKGGIMSYDIVVCRSVDRRVLLFIEVDGKQHFVDGEFDNQRVVDQFETTQKNDVQKEINAIKGRVPMIRLHQMDVWRKLFARGGFDWKPYLKRMLSEAWNEALPIKIFRQPGCKSYSSGLYQALRVDTIVAIE